MSKIEKFAKDAINEYDISIRVNEYACNISVDENNPRENFIQIGVRYLLDEDIFDESSDVESYAIGLIKPITLGEINHFTKTILNYNNIETKSMSISDLNPNNIIEVLSKYINGAMIVPLNILFKNWMTDISWQKYLHYIEIGKDPVIRDIRKNKEYNIFSVSEKLVPEIEKTILIYGKTQIDWRYVYQHNNILNNNHRLYLQVDEPNQQTHKREVMLRTLNKIDIKSNSRIIKINIVD